jgi:hypothetical protein
MMTANKLDASALKNLRTAMTAYAVAAMTRDQLTPRPPAVFEDFLSLAYAAIQ